jgi:hypothetical protein
MSIYMCRWPDGDVSLIDAENEADVLLALDEIGDPSDVAITPFEAPLFINLCLNNTGELMLAPDQGHFMFRVREEAYPALAAVEDAIDEERGDKERTPEDLAKVRLAVQQERGGTDGQQ